MKNSTQSSDAAFQFVKLKQMLRARILVFYSALLVAVVCEFRNARQCGVWAQVLSQTAARVVDVVLPLSNAHSHNDYEHTRPLMDALDEGFMSIEADVFLVNGDLLVAHNLRDVNPERNLDRLYLRPLYDRFLQNKGSIYKQPGTVILLVDIKRDGEGSYAELTRQLAPYADMLSICEDGRLTEKAVTIIISGDRPFEKIAQSNPRFVSIDGRLNDLAVSAQDQKSPALMPLVSDNWRMHFRYRGDGELSEEERSKLIEITTLAHKQGRKIRFWATPESEQLWKALTEAGVDLIGTDELSRLAAFLHD